MNQFRTAIAMLLVTICVTIGSMLLNMPLVITVSLCAIGIGISLAFFLFFGETVKNQLPFCLGALRIRGENMEQCLAGCYIRMSDDYLSFEQSKFKCRINRDEIYDAIAINDNTVDFCDIYGKAYRMVMSDGIPAKNMAALLNERVPF